MRPLDQSVAERERQPAPDPCATRSCSRRDLSGRRPFGRSSRRLSQSFALAIALLGLAEPTSAVVALVLRSGSGGPLAGFDVGYHAAPTLADLDGDGDLDAVSGRQFGTFAFFENTGTASSAVFAERTGAANPLDGLAAGSSYSKTALGDLDADGDLDLVAGSSLVSFAYFENTGTASSAVFVPRTGAANPLNGLSSGGNLTAPVAADLDGDGDLDLVAGSFSGLAYFENTGTPASLIFVQRTGAANPLNGFAVGEYCAPALADFDGDGDSDALVGRFDGTFSFFENTGAPTSPVFAQRTGAANPLHDLGAGAYSTPAPADLDADGDLDVVSGNEPGSFTFFENTGTTSVPAFSAAEAANSLAGFDVGSDATVAFADLDADADLDVVSGNESGTFALFENTGTAASPAFVRRTGVASPLDGFDTGDFSTAALVDIDADGDFDAFSGDYTGTFAFLENTGTAASPAFTRRIGAANPLDGFDVSWRSTATFADLDADGDFDAFSHKQGGFAFFENTGTALAAAFAQRSGTENPLEGLGANSLYGPAFADLDGDGDLDAFADNSAGAGGNVAFFENTGTPEGPAFLERTAGPLHPLAGFFLFYPKPAFADLDADGDLDAFAGLGDGTFASFENLGSVAGLAFLERPGVRNPLTRFDVGGLSRPTFADLEGDGDLDAVSGAGDGSFAFFENTGTALSPTYVWRSGAENPLAGLGVDAGSAPVFADLEGDGDLDAVSGAEDGSFAFFENTGTALSPNFAPRAGPANPLDGFDVGSWSAAALADLDGDGDLDVAAGGLGGTFAFFENTGDAQAPAFAARTGAANPFDGLGVFYLSAPALADLDGDGDFDLLSGEVDLYAAEIHFFENTGTAQAPAFAERTGLENPFGYFSSGGLVSAPALADVDGDGDLDAFSGSEQGAFVYAENTGTATLPGFVERTGRENPLLGVDVGDRSAPAFADIDGDGDFDAFIAGSGGSIAFFENTGTAAIPAFAERIGAANPLEGLAAGSWWVPTLADLDDDGDLDACAGSADGTFAFLENTGTATHSAFVQRIGAQNPLDGVDLGFQSAPAFGDLDADGDLDLVAGALSGGFAFFENTGTAGSPTLVLRSGAQDPLAGLSAGSRSTPALVDIDGDGDLDLVAGRGLGDFAFFENTGTAESPTFLERAGGAQHPLAGFVTSGESTPTLVDIDGDGDFDVFSGAGFGEARGTLLFLENATPRAASVPLPAWVPLASGLVIAWTARRIAGRRPHSR